MAKAIYSMKIELLLRGNEAVIKLTASELRSIHRFNRFVVCVYLQSWFTSRIVENAPVNGVQLIQRLNAYDDQVLRDCGLNMMKRHSWYISQELETLALSSHRLSSDEKTLLVANITGDRGQHLLKTLPQTIVDLRESHSLFKTIGTDDSFLDAPVESWSDSQSFKIAEALVKNLACVNDCAERGVALMQTFNQTVTKDEEQKQFVLQVVEKHRKDF